MRYAAIALLWASVGHAVGAGYAAEIQKWRERREARLRADDGWLTVAGLYWLKEGVNRFGAAAANEVAFPEGSAPALAGVLELHGGKVTLRVEPGGGGAGKRGPRRDEGVQPPRSRGPPQPPPR